MSFKIENGVLEEYKGSEKYVVIPDSVTKIGVYAFNYCKSLESIEVSENNQRYASEDGVLFSKDKATL